MTRYVNISNSELSNSYDRDAYIRQHLAPLIGEMLSRAGIPWTGASFGRVSVREIAATREQRIFRLDLED